MQEVNNRAPQKFFQIIPPNTNFDFVGKMKLYIVVTGVLVVVSLAGMFTKGFNFGIDFTGGTSVQIRFKDVQKVEDVRALAESAGAKSAEVRSLGLDGHDFLVIARTIAEMKGEAALANQLMLKAGGPSKATILQVDVVGPRTGSELRIAAMLSLLYSILLIMIYIWFRFDVMFAPGCIFALVHDLIIVAGFYVFTGWEFTITGVAVLLTIAGYSVNDTIVVYDRIREMLKLKGDKVSLSQTVNLAINATLSRTFLTSFITFISVIPLIIFTEDELRGFAIAMAIGIVSGTLSTWFIAVPFTIVMEKFVVKKQAKAGGGRNLPRPATT